MNEKIFKAMLAEITPESIKEAKELITYFGEQLRKVEDPSMLSNGARGVFIAALLVEYGKQKAGES